LGLERTPDKNRFIGLELQPPKEWFTIPTASEIQQLGRDSLAVAIKCGHTAIHLHQELRRVKLTGIDPRVIEGLAVPAAMIVAAGGGENAEELLTAMATGVDSESLSVDQDELELLRDILAAIVPLDRGDKTTVGEILRDAASDGEQSRLLSRYGVTRVAARPGPRTEVGDVFIAGQIVRRELLKATKWTDQNVNQLLRRLEGAKADQRSIAASKSRGVTVPWRIVEQELSDGDELSREDF